jgi:hypothetical protein
LLFIPIGIVRYWLDLQAAPPDDGMLSLFAAGSISLVVATLAVAVLFTLPAALLGVITALLVRGALAAVKPKSAPWRAVGIGTATCLLLALLIHLALSWVGVLSWSSMASATYLLWLGIPSLLYVIAGGLFSWRWCSEVETPTRGA